MAVKQSVEVTVIDIADADALVMWYQLSSSATKPAKPTTADASVTPTGWTKAEPGFDSSQGTKYLYTSLQTVWGDGTCDWGDVQLDSSYEAAKQAWNQGVSLGQRMTTAEATIERHTDSIALKANSSDVYTTTQVDGLISQEVTNRNAAITTASDSITASVAETYATKTEFENLEIGGRNLLRYVVYNYADANSVIGVSSLYRGMYCAVDGGETYTISRRTVEGNRFWIDWSEQEPASGVRLNNLSHDNTALKVTVNVPSEANWLFIYLSNQGDAINDGNIKVERGNVATDWTPAPEDIETRVTEAEAAITVNAGNIALKANSADVYTKTSVDGLISQEVTNRNAAIEVASDAIASTVSETYATKTSVDETYDKTQSRGEQLVTNGSAILGDNTNFSSWTFDGSKTNGSKGSFTRSVGATTIFTDETFAVDISKEYIAEFDVLASGSGEAPKMYAMLAFYDVDGNNISAQTVGYYSGSTTTLAQDLNDGDTVVYFTDLSGWNTTTTAGHQRAFIFWNYTNSYGYTYPAETYSRNFYSSIYSSNNSVNKSANTITLSSAWSGGTIAAGTSVSQNRSGGTYAYFWYDTSGTKIPTDTWLHASGTYSGTDYSGNFSNKKFRPGTAYCKVGWLWNWNSGNTSTAAQKQLWITNVSVKENVATAAEVDGLATRMKSAESSIVQNAEAITSKVSTTDYTGATIASLINQSASTVTIEAEHIELDGTAVFNSISGSVNNAISTAVDAIEVGGRNLLVNTGDYSTWDALSSDATITRSSEYIKFTPPASARWWTIEPHEAYIPLSSWDTSATYTVSIDVKFDNLKSAPSYPKGAMSAVTNNTTVGYTARVYERSFATIPTTNDWTHFEYTVSGDYTTWTNVASGTPAYIKVCIWLFLSSSNADAVSFRDLKLEKGTKATDWTPAPEDVDDAIATAQETADGANYQEQAIYISKASGTTSVTGTMAWITSTSDVQNTWTTKRPTYDSSYPVLFVATQRKTVSGTITCTVPLKDDTTTVIDGGHITTGTIDASVVNVTNIDADNITSGTIDATRIDAAHLTIGQSQVTNLTDALAGKADTDDIPTKTSDLTNDSSFATTSDVNSAVSQANSEEQLIYISKASGTSSVSANTTWVTSTSDSQDTWTTKRPTYSDSYPVLFIATQRKTVGGTVTCTAPLKDDTTTIIDGGHITTGTIDASAVTVTNLNGSNITSGTISAARIDAAHLTIGQSQVTNLTSDLAGKAEAISAAAMTATSYITAVDNDGIWVTPSDAKPVSGAAAATTSGWHISDALELFRAGTSMFKIWVENAVTKLRLGAENTANVILSQGYLASTDGSDTVFSVGRITDADGYALISETHYLDTGSSTIQLGYILSRIKVTYTEEDGATVITIDDLSITSDGSEITDYTVNYIGQASGTLVRITLGTPTTYEGKTLTVTYYARPGTGMQVGSSAQATGDDAVAFGISTATGKRSFAHGIDAVASGSGSHAEGGYLNGDFRFEGGTATGGGSHAEGSRTVASGTASHAEGIGSEARHRASHAGGQYTTTADDYQTVIGTYNAEVSGAFVIGNGTLGNVSNALYVTWDGEIMGGDDKSVLLGHALFSGAYADTRNTGIALMGDSFTAYSRLLVIYQDAGGRYGSVWVDSPTDNTVFGTETFAANSTSGLIVRSKSYKIISDTIDTAPYGSGYQYGKVTISTSGAVSWSYAQEIGIVAVYGFY